MSLPSSIKLLKLSSSQSHINSRRLSIVVNLASKLSDSNGNRAKHLDNSILNEQFDQFKEQNVQQIAKCKNANECSLDTKSSLSSTNLLSSKLNSSNLSTKTDALSSRSIDSINTLDLESSRMGSSSSKCTKITDNQPANHSSTNGWISAHNFCHNLTPQLNQPYLHHSCSMINLADCVCCHSYLQHHHDGKCLEFLFLFSKFYF